MNLAAFNWVLNAGTNNILTALATVPKRLVLSAFLAFSMVALLGGCGRKASEAQTGSKTDAASATSASPAPTEEPEIITENEEKERDDFEKQIVSLLLKGGFAQLDSIADELRNGKSRFRDGRWKLLYFYRAFDDFPADSSEAGWQKLVKAGEAWPLSNPGSATAKIALAEIYCDYAWKARGHDVADKVTPEGWKLMQERLVKAMSEVQQGAKLGPKFPEWHATLQRIALGSGIQGADYEKIFENGVKAAPDYGAIYNLKAYYLLPRWFGKEGAWETFAIGMMKRGDIPASKEIFARAAINLWNMNCFFNEFSGKNESWELLKESFREIEKNYPDSLEVKSIFCLFCLSLRDNKEAKLQMQLIGNKVDLSVWKKEKNFLSAVDWLNQSESEWELEKQKWKNSRKK